MSKHSPKKYSTEARDPKTKEKVIAYAFSCIPCQVYGKLFKSKSARDRFAKEHQ